MKHPPEQQRGPGCRDRGHAEISRRQGTDHEQGSPSQGQREVIALGVGLPPCGHRGLWAWVVARCPFCGLPHLHRGGPAGGLRRAGCGKGSYLVTARRKRGRWAA